MESKKILQGSIKINKNPDKCPYCHHKINPIYISGNVTSNKLRKDIVADLIYKCPSNNCNRLFIGSYKINLSIKLVDEFIYIKSEPLIHELPYIDEDIVNISPNFRKIYGQANIAENSGLDEIAGVGYRKALEFLIKDYCIFKNTEKKDEIKSYRLGKVIKNFIDDENIKTCAERAVWLGNDETHYVRKWENKDIEDLKILIKLTSNWIKNNILTNNYLEEMPSN